jgi:uncharacterized RDD family membrane protein YckC
MPSLKKTIEQMRTKTSSFVSSLLGSAPDVSSQAPMSSSQQKYEWRNRHAQKSLTGISRPVASASEGAKPAVSGSQGQPLERLDKRPLQGLRQPGVEPKTAGSALDRYKKKKSVYIEDPTQKNITVENSRDAGDMNSQRSLETKAESGPKAHVAADSQAPLNAPLINSPFDVKLADSIRSVNEGPRFTHKFSLIYRPAPFGVRAQAEFVDYWVICVLSYFLKKTLAGVGLAWVYSSMDYGFVVFPWQQFSDPVFLLTKIFYSGWFYQYRGATPGKILFNLTVLRNDNQVGQSFGPAIGFFKAVVRELIGKTISYATLGAGFTLSLLRLDHRALHDLIVGTVVMQRIESQEIPRTLA